MTQAEIHHNSLWWWRAHIIICRENECQNSRIFLHFWCKFII